MPKIVEPTELNKLVERVGRFADGVGVDQLLRALRGNVTRRTLQRRLALLVQQQRLQAQGAGRSVTYRLPTIAASVVVVEDADTLTASAEVYVPMSRAGAEVRSAVRRPITSRQPVGYRIELLDAYEPNVSFYLDASLRAQLLGMGRAPLQVATDTAVAGTFARDILNRLLIDLSWASSRLEGNTYSRLDTERLIEQGEAAQGKDAVETQMILNHKAAIEYLVHDAERVGVNTETIIALHALLSDGLLADPLACGRLRSRAVDIGGSVYRPLALPQRLHDLFDIVIERAAAIADPFEQSFFLMVHLPYLQPFEDMNKRVSRLAANIPLIRENLSPLSFVDVPQRAYVEATLGVYEQNRIDLLRDVFIWAYERSCQQYVAVRSQLVPPDLFRLRHRVPLGETVRAIVRGQQPATARTVRKAAPKSVPTADRDAFARLVLDELRSLHAGNAVRFGLRPIEFDAWFERSRQSPKK